MSKRGLLRLAVAFFLASPFVFLILEFGVVSSVDFDEILWATKNTFQQAFLSATVSVLLGWWGAMGLVSFTSANRRRYRSVLELLLLMPNFLPPLFTLLAVLNIVDPFPMGIPGIVIIHTAINWGLVAVLIAGLFESKLGAVAELAWVEGTSRWRFLKQIAFPMIRRDVALLWIFVFSVCFGSFSVPLVVGGGRGTTLEVLIYERIRLSTDWSQAVVIAGLQSILLFLIALVASRGTAVTSKLPLRLELLRSHSGIGLAVVLTAGMALGYLQGLPQGFSQLPTFLEIGPELFQAALGSVWMGLATGMLTLFLLFLTATLTPSSWFEKFLTGFAPPSQALAGFAVLVTFPSEGFWPYLKIPLTLSLLTFPVLWRMGWRSDVEGLRGQREVAETLGAGSVLFAKVILIPQLAARATTLSGLAAVWAVGDFALSRILAHRDLTLAMITETLMSGYRLSLATVLSVGLLVIGLGCFAGMKGVGRVLGRKSLP